MKIYAYILALISIISSSLASFALDPSHYAEHSVLAEGRWQRVKVNSTGVHLISNSDLKSMGFSDPSKVHIYGTGGAMVREALASDMPDDLPMVKSVVTSRGILFFGTDNTSWNPRKAIGERHLLNPYVAESYYWVSDREVPENSSQPVSPASATKTADLLKTFEERISYEKDLATPSDLGRMILGEDFRTTKSQTFNFTLPDIASPAVTAAVRFAAKTTNGVSQLKLSANGTELAASSSDKIMECGNTEFIKSTTTVKSFNLDGDKLALNIDYSYTGVLYTARLDYIEVFYTRALKIGTGGELHFYHDFGGETVALEGCSAETVIWDVTYPWNPVAVEYLLEGNTAFFTPTAGYHEFIAFNPANAGRTITRAGLVSNQNIHGTPAPDMVIISNEEYLAGAKRIARLHEEHDGFRVEILTPSDIYNEFSGGHADVSAFRKLLKMWHDRPSDRTLRYALIMGRGIYDYKLVASGKRNAGFKPVPIWQDPTGNTEVSAFSTDDYLGMLDDCTENSFDMTSAQIRVPVGRLPVRTATEATQVAAKIEKYVTQPNYGSWRNHVMLVADDQDKALHLLQSETLHNHLVKNAPHYHYEKLYLDAFTLESTSVGNTYPKAQERLFRLWNEGIIYTNYVGHASQDSWTHEKLMLWNDITSLNNANLTFLIAATCSFGHWDDDRICGAEYLVLKPDAGFIGAIVPSRTVYMTPNGTLNSLMADHILTTDADGKGTRFGDVFARAKNAFNNDSNKLRYCLMADPALRIPKPTRNVRFETINGIDITSGDELPELQALDKATVRGSVINPDGSLAQDFNGTISLDLYDAESVVTTYGNGSEGESSTYNDRRTRLSAVSATVIAGKWEADILLPAEIANNMSPARIEGYAWNGEGTEANGSTESLYVIGYPEEESADKTGPTITEFYLNNKDFADNGHSHSNPVVHASFFDESGINISDSGIGHKMSVTLDNSKVFDDVYTCYIPDPENPSGGSIAYPLENLESGEHTIKFTVYDNANNSSSRTLTVNVVTANGPGISNLTTDVNPASTAVVFSVTVDHPNTKMTHRIEVFDLSGKKIWSSEQSLVSDMHGLINTPWDLRDSSGHRVPRGIYLYRAYLETENGMHTSETRKLAVTAQ